MEITIEAKDEEEAAELALAFLNYWSDDEWEEEEPWPGIGGL
jgi:hypothetical protein